MSLSPFRNPKFNPKGEQMQKCKINRCCIWPQNSTKTASSVQPNILFPSTFFYTHTSVNCIFGASGDNSRNTFVGVPLGDFTDASELRSSPCLHLLFRAIFQEFFKLPWAACFVLYTQPYFVRRNVHTTTTDCRTWTQKCMSF